MSKREPLTFCCVCGEKSRARFKGKEYCKKHFSQMYRHGHILERTIFDRNEWNLYDDYAECITYNKNFEPNGKVKFDLDDYEKLKNDKVYICNHNGKFYAVISSKNLHKIFAHRFVMNIHKEEYSIDKVIDHINGDTLDNRKSNLRICHHKNNMKNIRKENKIVGVNIRDGKFLAKLMNNYKYYNLGCFDTYEEAVLARITKEKELCGEYGANKDLYYVLDAVSPIEELKVILN